MGKKSKILKNDKTVNVSIAAMPNDEFKPLPHDLNIEDITSFRDKVDRLNGQTLTRKKRQSLFPVALRETIIDRVIEWDLRNKPEVKKILKGSDPSKMFKLKHDAFFRLLIALYQPPGIKDAKQVVSQLEAEIAALPMELFGDDRKELENFVMAMKNVGIAHGLKNGEALYKMFNEKTAKNLLKLLAAKFKTEPREENKLYEEMYRELTGNDKPQDLSSWVSRALQTYTTCCDNLALGNHCRPKRRLQGNGNPYHVKAAKPPRRDQPAPEDPVPKENQGQGECTFCGRLHNLSKGCFDSKHPDANPTKSRFLDTVKGKAYAKLGERNLKNGKKLAPDLQSLVDDPSLVHTKVSMNSTVILPSSSHAMLNNLPMSIDNRGHLFHLAAVRPVTETLLEKARSLPSKLPTAKTVARASQVSIDAHLVDTRHDVRVEKDGVMPKTNISVILDTGALEYNYISYKYAYDMNLDCTQLDRNIIVSSIDGSTVIKRFVIIPKLTLVNNNKKFCVHNQIFLVLPHCPVNLIIGLPTIREHDLTSVFKDYFKSRHRRILRSQDSEVQFRKRLIQKYQEIKRKSGERAAAGAPPSKKTKTAPHGRQDPLAAGLFVTTDSNSPGIVAQTKEVEYTPSMPNPRGQAEQGIRTPRFEKTDFLDGDPDDDEIDTHIRPTGWDDYFDRTQEATNRKPATTFEQATINESLSSEEKQQIIAALQKYYDRFDTKVASPAAIPPFEIKLNAKKWRQGMNNKRKYVRQISEAKKRAVEAFIKQALQDGLIQLSTAGSFSQVLLTKKSNGKWRFCVDYRALNELSESLGWPIPNIKQLLNNIGQHRPKYFAVLDLTSGYYQAPLAQESRELTAFITHMGLYEWTRVPMGAKGAPPYFQYQMVNTVFAGLIHNICEIYLDDIIIWGASINELTQRLEKILQRAQKYNIIFNPEKCRFGMSEVEYVGHVINSTGLSFTQAKRDKVENFRLPTTVKEMKSFLGLASYFRDHVRDFTTLSHPLREMMESKQRGPLHWTEEKKGAFRQMQQAVINCPQNRFMEPGHPIYVQTDASDFGIGAYLFQNVAGEERPIGFISKTLNRTERKWSTIEKEAFAIFYALQKWEEYLRDVKFTLQTDHLNLTFINSEPKQKVQRWKLAIQSFDFWIEHIPGKDNIVADGLSRFCKKDQDMVTTSLNLVYNITTLHESMQIDEEFQRASEAVLLLSKQKQTRQSIATSMNKRMTVEQLRQRKGPLIIGGQEPQRYIQPKRYELLNDCHNTDVGHWGVQRTMEKVRTKQQMDPKCKIKLHQYSEKDLRLDTVQFIRDCPCCQKMTQLKPYIHTYKYVAMKHGILENLAMDTITGLPKTANGNEYLLVVIDTFSRYTQLYPLADLTALTAAKTLSKWMNTFGRPFSILTDNAPQFQAAYKQALEELGIDDRKSHPYSHEENAMVERTNKEVERHLRNIMFQEKVLEKWDEFCPAVERIKNNEVCTSTGVSPVELIFGRNVNLDRGILYPTLQTTPTGQRLSDFIAEQAEYQRIVFDIASQNQAATDAKHLESGQIGEKAEFQIGDHVLVYYENDDHRAPTKLHPVLRGPCEIISRRPRPEGDLYTVHHLDSSKYEEFHVKLLRKFNYDSNYTDPRIVAQADNQSFTVERILDHKFTPPNRKIKSNMWLKVQWKGYPTPTWEPYSNVAKVRVFHDYLIEQGLHALLREPFKPPTMRQRK